MSPKKLPDSALGVVGDAKHEKVMFRLGQFSFDSDCPVKICLNFWYPLIDDARVITPVAAEFCFDYDLPKSDLSTSDTGVSTTLEQFPLTTVLGARRLFDAVQQQSTWVDLSGTTKTDLVYGEP